MDKKITPNSIRKDISFRLNGKTDNQKHLIRSIEQSAITVCYGMAGTGKTYVSVMKASKMFQEGKIDKIYLIKSVTALKGEEVGFIKGDLKEKIKPYAYSFMHAFNKLLGEDIVRKMEHLNIIEFLPIAFLRGVSLEPNSIVLVDEAQNISTSSLRTILTRIEEGCRLVVLGDTKQVDMKNHSKSSLKFFIDNFQKFNNKDIRFIEFTAEDQVRNPLIVKLEKRFNELEESHPEMFKV